MNAMLVCLVVSKILGCITALDALYQNDADYRAGVITLTEAHNALTRVQADPDTTLYARKEAEERLHEATARLATMARTVQGNIVDTVCALRIARLNVTLMEARQRLASIQVDDSTSRLQHGEGSRSEVEHARAQAYEAKCQWDGAKRDLAGAEATVHGQVMVEIASTDPPSLDVKAIMLKDHAELIAARNRISVAERALALAQGADTAPVDRAASERELAAARKALQLTRDSLQNTLEEAKRRYVTGGQLVQSARISLQVSVKELHVVKAQLIKGDISRAEVVAIEITSLENQLHLEEVHREYWQAYQAMQLAAGGRS